jgi:hypothetical protein
VGQLIKAARGAVRFQLFLLPRELIPLSSTFHKGSLGIAVFRLQSHPIAFHRPVETLLGTVAHAAVLRFSKASIISIKLYQGTFMNSAEAHRLAEALFKKEQQSREAQQAAAEYDAEQRAMQEITARLRALRLARDAANQGGAAEPNSTRAPTGRESR